MSALSSFVTGCVVGAVFAIMALPVPAPQSLAGVLGVAGLAVGYAVIRSVL